MTSLSTSRIQGCWMGKSIGGTLGLPAEGRMERLNFAYYDPVPLSAPPNDDLELQLVWLHLVENAGSSLSQADFAKAWLDHIHYMWDEYGRCRWNLRRNVPVECVGTFENHFHAGMGSPIRSEIWACLFPGDSDSAAHYAALDASLDHGTEGVAGEVLFSVMQSSVAAGCGLEDAISLALRYIPENCETAAVSKFILDKHAKGIEEWACWEALLANFGNENFTHAPLNVGLVVWALWYGGGDFEKSILLAVNGGYDTDCTAATVGATLGLMLGVDGIPQRWIEPIGEDIFVGPGIIGIAAPATVSELTDRTRALIGKLDPKLWDASLWTRPLPKVELRDLPGTISLVPKNNDQPVLWANGELPKEVKVAAGAQWTWDVTTDEPREIVCLARQGAKLFIDETLVLECIPQLPYIPATHRDVKKARVRVALEPGSHTVRVELRSTDPEQEASVILAYPNLHICPWTAQELPDAAELPPYSQFLADVGLNPA